MDAIGEMSEYKCVKFTVLLFSLLLSVAAYECQLVQSSVGKVMTSDKKKHFYVLDW